jgi:hypothetical protein
MNRVGTIVLADVRIRFRKLSTLIVFVLLSSSAYLWVPDPRTGRALLEIDGKRALYNSAAIGMGTAAMATIFVGLIGYYVISNALRRDVSSRCGFVLASTGMRSSEYLAGKFLGNVVFLATFLGGFMVTSMGMLIVRGEAPLQPLVFAQQYLYVLTPSIFFVSAIAILFESIPFLSGRFGDVAYFVFWCISFSAVAMVQSGGHGPGLAAYFDVSGLGFLMDAMKITTGTEHVSIGAATFDPSHGIRVFPGLAMPASWILPRIVASLLCIPVLGLALLFFHRFDPARVRVSGKARGDWMGRLNALVKPVARLVTMMPIGRRASLVRSAVADAMLTLTAFPIAVAAVIGFAIAALAAGGAHAGRQVLPIAFAAAAIAVAGVASREAESGTTALVASAPLLQPRFIVWKLLASLVVALAFLAVPMLVAGFARPSAIVPMLIGLFFICSAATALGAISTNAKTFLVLFLMFWYVVMNDAGLNPALDFAGFYGKSTSAVALAYLGAAIAFVVAAQAVHVARLRAGSS